MTSTPDLNTASYSYLGPAGTFTEAALKQVPEAVGAHWKSVNNVGEALDDVTSGRSVAAMIAIENSVEGGVSATQDALTTVPNLRIMGEYPGITEHYDLDVLATEIGNNQNAVTRFVLVSSRTELPKPTGADKTSMIVELPDDKPGRLLEMLEQFATRGVNLSLIESLPIGDSLGRYRFVIDVEGHIFDERVADALLGLKRFSPNVIFLGSYPRADKLATTVTPRYGNDVFVEARDWLRAITTNEPPAR